MKINPEKEEIEHFARQILAAARTAPKACGIDDVVTAIVEKQDIPKISAEMRQIAKRSKKFAFFERDSRNLEASDTVLIIGVRGKSLGLDCGACGMSCAEQVTAKKKTENYTGPNCAFKLLDLGIAIGSAAKASSLFSVDTRVMYSIGLAAKRLGLINADVALALPLSIGGKSPYFDR